MKITTLQCDICKEQNKVENKVVPVIFHTEQTEGRTTEPYLVFEKIDVCEKCYEFILNHNCILNAYGAQGHNTYTFPKDVK